jgi:hypothetical protein
VVEVVPLAVAVALVDSAREQDCQLRQAPITPLPLAQEVAALLKVQMLKVLMAQIPYLAP